MGRQLVFKMEELTNPIFTRPEGIQIPSELVEEQFHVHPEMVPEYIGIPKDSLLARAMFDGDYLGKRLMNRPDLKRKIPGYQTDFEFEVKHPQFRHTSGNYRVWISVDKMDTPQSQDEKALAFRDVKMRFNIREQDVSSCAPMCASDKSGKRPAQQTRKLSEEHLASLWDDGTRYIPP